MAAKLGADAIGLNFHSASPRRVDEASAREIVAAVPPGVETYAVFVDATPDRIRDVVARTGIAAVQLHGSEPPQLLRRISPLRVLRAFRCSNGSWISAMSDYLAACAEAGAAPVGVILDAYDGKHAGGTGTTWDWSQATLDSVPLPAFIAGGLTAENVERAIALLRPFGVDVAGGVESEQGTKDPARLAEFIAAVRRADRRIESADRSGLGEFLT